MKNIKGSIKLLLALALSVTIVLSSSVFAINGYVISNVRKNIISEENAVDIEADCILVLGCRVLDNKEPSHMLEDRLIKAVKLYGRCGKKLLMSGDHSSDDYNEVAVMKNYAIEKGVNEADILSDHLGFSTYESVSRAKNVYGAKKIIIVTQEYHLYRALYIAKSMGMEAYGVACDRQEYKGQIWRDIREAAARVKDYLLV